MPAQEPVVPQRDTYKLSQSDTEEARAVCPGRAPARTFHCCCTFEGIFAGCCDGLCCVAPSGVSCCSDGDCCGSLCCSSGTCCATPDGDPFCCPNGQICWGPPDSPFCCPVDQACANNVCCAPGSRCVMDVCQ